MPARGKKHVVVTTLDGGSVGSDVDDRSGVDEMEAAPRLPPSSTTEVGKTKRTASAAQLEALKRARDRAKALRDDARGRTAATSRPHGDETAAREDTATKKTRHRGATSARRAASPVPADDEAVGGSRASQGTVAAPRRKRVERRVSPATTDVGEGGDENAGGENMPASKRARHVPRAERAPRSQGSDITPRPQATHAPVKPREPSPPPPPPPPPREPSPPPPPPPPPAPPPPAPRPGFMRSVDGVFFFNRDD